MTALLHRPPLTVSASAAQGFPTPCDLHHIASTRTHRVSPVLPVCAASPLLSPLCVCSSPPALVARRSEVTCFILMPSFNRLTRSRPSIFIPLLFFVAHHHRSPLLSCSSSLHHHHRSLLFLLPIVCTTSRPWLLLPFARFIFIQSMGVYDNRVVARCRLSMIRSCFVFTSSIHHASAPTILFLNRPSPPSSFIQPLLQHHRSSSHCSSSK